MSRFAHVPHVSPRQRRHRRAAAILFTICLALTSASVATAQHVHNPPAPRDSARADTGAAHRAPRGEMGAMPTAQAGGHDMASMMDGPLGVSHVRMGSGTTWMPDSSPMHANHFMWGDWTGMVHGVAFGQYDFQGSKRGDEQFGIVDWEMLMLMRRIGTGQLHLHGMASLEPLTLGARGYPLLLQTGESYRGRPLHDRQHPHDAVMELAALFQQPVGRGLAVELYGGLAGEPALGPVAFMHRPSAQSDPLAPLGHHWQDATHISYGVVTAGVYSRRFKLEGSAFNGREPDENRWNLDLGRLDSYSGRLTVNPTGRLSLAGWYGYLPSPEALHPDESVHRYGASALYGGRGVRGGAWESTLLWGANEHAGQVANSFVAETNLELGARNTVFGRAELVRKSAEDLVLPGVDAERQFDVRSLVLGYVREIATFPGGTLGLGGRASVNLVPSTVGRFYGTNTPAGVSLYLRVRPKAMASHAAPQMAKGGHGMSGMEQHAPGHTMPMPAAERPSAHDSASARHEMMEMPGMPAREDSAAVRDSITGHAAHDSASAHPSTRADSATAAKPDAKTAQKAHEKVARKAKPAAKKPPRKPAPKPAAPAGHDMPGMQHMPGMKMPADSSRRP